MKFVDVKNDVAFRKIFGNENKKTILISFLNAILKLENERKIETIEIVNPYQLGRLKGEKVTIIDVKARDQRKHEYIVEMQVTEKKGLDKRIQYYSARGYSNQIESGDDYVKLKPMVFIGIIDFEYMNSNNYISRHLILDVDTQEHKLKDLEFNFIELAKFNKKLNELDNLVDKWVYFLKHAKDLEVIPENVKDEGLKEAYQEANRHNWTKEELDEYEYAKMRETDDKMEKELAIENKILEIAKKGILAGYSNDIIKTMTELSDEKINTIRNQMTE